MTKNVVKFFGGAIAIVAIGMGILFAIDYIRYQKSPEYQAQKEVEHIKKEYREDPYGGDTPEETLHLFIEALKKGDTNLAAKYFVLDKQEEWRGDLAKIQEKGLLGEMIGDLGNLKADKIEGDTARYFIVAENGQGAPLVLIRIANGKWKIRTL